MLKFEPAAAQEKVPVLVVCGVDSPAKAETIQRTLATSNTRWAVISNETEGPDFAATVTDRVGGQMVPHAIGCLCCVTRSGLVSSLRRLYAMRAQGETDFSQVVVETLPDADPAPVMQTLLNNALVTEYFRLDSVVCAITAAGLENLSASSYGLKQVAVADRVVLGTDVDASNEARGRLRHLNPAADMLPSEHPALSESLQGAGLETQLLRDNLNGWLAEPHYVDSDELEDGLHGFAVEFDVPLSWDAFHGWLNAGTQSNGDFMYRTKGSVQVIGLDGPVVINGAQHVFQPPLVLSDTTSEYSRLLFITDDLDREAVETSLRDDLPQFGRISEARAARAARAALDPSIPL
ncbi:MAG: GTP-binding protein [Pseudomonadota bacterium]